MWGPENMAPVSDTVKTDPMNNGRMLQPPAWDLRWAKSGAVLTITATPFESGLFFFAWEFSLFSNERGSWEQAPEEAPRREDAR
jgi:hypothetical protein